MSNHSKPLRRPHRHRRSQSCVLVLWDTHFEELSAVTFVTEFRRLGIRTLLVGLHTHPTPGAHGVTLSPDITLDTALTLAEQTICILLPCGCAALRRLENEPRLPTLLLRAQTNGAQLVVGCQEASKWSPLDLPFGAFAQVTIFAQADGQLLQFVQQMAQTLGR